MKINYSYKAFFFSVLIVGNLLLLMYVIKIGGFTPETEQSYEVEYLETLPKEEQPLVQEKKVAVTTHRAYNEAEEFIKNIETENTNFEEETTAKLNELDNALSEALSENTSLSESKKKLSKLVNTPSSKNKKKTKKEQNVAGNTTISYRLVNRKARLLPNPVYVCDGYGKVVVNITVNATGKVMQASINKAASTTTNECLFDSAIQYAKQSFFTQGNKETQLGSITYLFPGQ